jgi:hypothetical protein
MYIVYVYCILQTVISVVIHVIEFLIEHRLFQQIMDWTKWELCHAHLHLMFNK